MDNNKLTPNAINRLSKGTIIFNEGEPVRQIAMLIMGRVIMRSQGAKIILAPGSFIGINDLYKGKYQSVYEAYEDIALHMYPVSKPEDLEEIIAANNEYNGYIVASLNRIVYEFNNICNDLAKEAASLCQFLKSAYQQCLDLVQHKMNFPKCYNRIMSQTAEDSNLELLQDRINYFCECRNLPISVVKQFYSHSNAITLYDVDEQVNIIGQQMEAVKNLIESYASMAKCIMDDTDSCLFNVLVTLAGDQVLVSEKNNYMLDILDNIISEVNKASGFLLQMAGREIAIDRMKIEKLNHLLLTRNTAGKNNANRIGYSEEEIRKALDDLKESFDKILAYAEIVPDEAEEMKKVMQNFIMLKDKFTNDDQARVIRKRISDNFYNIYMKAFIKAYNDACVPRPVEMFLKYGYCDERLLTEEQLLYFYFLQDDEQDIEPFKVYDIVTWLKLIYEGKKEPSKNEFDLDYSEMLLDMKRQGRLNENQILEWQTDRNRKLEYEIQNMFRYNNRIVNGQITSFVPVLHKDMLIGDMDRIKVTRTKVKASMDKLIGIDYSIFDREVLYTNEEKNIKKEYIVKKVYPDIILMPTVGANGIMWQDITGKKRDTPGRFILPAYTEIDLDTMLAKVMGRFRWEKCRTIEGAMWNDISNKSLTSEYTYYLQFYKKMRELSEEKKEKIKNQLQRGRNIREVFVADYLSWVLYESAGAIKLTKPAREILATYCPFSRQIREQLRHQPIFEEAMNRFYSEKKKKIREIENRYRLLERERIEITQELKDTLIYYKES